MSNGPETEERPPTEWRVKPLHSPEEGSALPITEEGVSIGRAESNDIVLPSADFPGVSSAHAKLTLRGDSVFLEDMGSKNGTYIADETVTRTLVDHGVVFELGSGGPRFVVLSSQGADHTVEVRPPKRTIGEQTMEVVREKLGIPAHTKVTDVVTRENRRNRWLLVVVLIAVVVGGVYGIDAVLGFGDRVARLEKQVDEQLAASKNRIERYRRDSRTQVEEIRSEYERTNRKNLEESKRERARLQKQIDTAGSAEKARIAELREALKEAEDRIERYNPVNLENERIQHFGKTRSAVVFIDVKKTFVDSKTKRKLFIDERGGNFDPNLNGRGKPYLEEGTGSGFCFTKDGWILTNAHVVFKKDSEETLPLGPGLVLQSDLTIHVVFNGTGDRIPATLEDWDAEGDRDLALLKIVPPKNMPFIPGIDTKRGRPKEFDTVYLMGFPFGKNALMGQQLTASAFRGIVSRNVGDFIQVDAAVHSGNSGGPVIGQDGQVIGVVVGVQRIDEDKVAADMGFIIPIKLAGTLWPFNPNRPHFQGK